MPKPGAATAKTAAPKKSAGRKKANGYQTPEKIPLGEVLTDLSKQQWRIGPSIGAGGFGEIYSACKNDSGKIKAEDYPYVVKVEPHGNGPLFVEMHFYMRNGKSADIEAFRKKNHLKTLGMPHFVGHGSHELNGIKHRFIVMPRFGQDIWSIFLKNNRKMPTHTVYRLAIQMLDVYQYIHECTYVHADLKAANILLGFGKNGGQQAYLVDFGLAGHYTTKDFKPDPKKMHNGTIEYTSRDAHQGVPTMRGDMEVLAYNLIQWTGVSLPWELQNLLGTPVKVQNAKEEFMKDVDSGLSKCFGSAGCPSPILSFVKYVAKMKYNDVPDYEKFRMEFEKGMKTLGKSNAGDLDFNSSAKATTSAKEKPSISKNKEILKDTKRTVKSTSIVDVSDNENVSPRKRPMTSSSRSKKRTSSSEHVDDEEEVVPKKVRSKVPSSRAKSVVVSQSQVTGSSSPSLVVNNGLTTNGSTKKNKTYELNFELDISFDANVIVNVKRKPKTDKKETPRKESGRTKKPSSVDTNNASIKSTEEIPATEQSVAVGTARVLKRSTRASPRTKK